MGTKGERNQGMGYSGSLGLHTPLCLEYVTNKDLLCSTGNSTFCNDLYRHRIKKRVDVCICFLEKKMATHPSILAWEIPLIEGLTDSLCCTAETNTKV